MELSPKQAQLVEAALSGEYLYLLYGGAIRGGKSFCAILTLFLLARIFPGSRWAIVRKDLPTLRRNTVPTIEKVKPEGFAGRLNQSDWTITCRNGSQIILFPESIGPDPDLDRWKGLEVNGFVLEEANELDERSWFKAIERAGSWIVPGLEHQPPPLILLTSNPAFGWLKQTFYDPWKVGGLEAPYYYLPATVHDNPHLALEYLASLRNLPDHEYRRFVEGDWTVAAGLALHEWNDAVHVQAHPEPCPPGWRVVAGMDWGIRAKSCVALGYVGPDKEILWRKEWTWKGKDAYDAGYEWGMSLLNSGLPFPEVILADAAMWQQTGIGGKTVGQEFADGVVAAMGTWAPPVVPAPHGPGSRKVKLSVIKKMLAWGPYLADGTLPASRRPAMRFVGPDCPYLVSSLPALPFHPNNSDDVDTKADDHGYDAIGNVLVAEYGQAVQVERVIPVDLHPGMTATGRRRNRVRNAETEAEEALEELQAAGVNVGGRYGMRPPR